MSISGFLVHKHGLAAEFDEDTILHDFMEESNRRSLYLPTFGILLLFIVLAIGIRKFKN